MRRGYHKTIRIGMASLALLSLVAVGFKIGFSAVGSYAKYVTKNESVTATLSVAMPHYTVIFDANGGSGTMESQDYVYGTEYTLPENVFTSIGESFLGWNTKADGSGHYYADQAEVKNLATSGSVTLYAQWEGGLMRTVFKLDGACTFGGINGAITGDDCVDYHGNNYVGNKYIDTGILLYDDENYDADYEIGFTIDRYVAGENVNQATFVNAKYENSAAGYPGLVVRRGGNGGMEITQTIDNNVKVSKTVTVSNGMNVVIKRIDGVVYYSINGGSLVALQDMSSFTSFFDIAAWFGAAPDANGNPMRVLVGTLSNMYIKMERYNSTKHALTFDSQNGSLPITIHIKDGAIIGGRMPADPTRELEGDTQYYFNGWFTSDGQRVTRNYVVTKDETIVAHWRDSNTACMIGDAEYNSIQQAITAAGSNPATITLLRDTHEQNITVAVGQKITFDLGDYIMYDNGVQTKPVIDNYGEVIITNGIFTSNQRAGVINNNTGATLRMSGGQVLATGLRQAIYNDGGYVEISGDAYLKAESSERATVHNLNNGTVEIKGGTIIATQQEGVLNASGNVIIGVSDDGIVGGSTPVIQGATYGVNATVGVEYYDGVLRGITAAINDEQMILASETNANMVVGTTQIGSVIYQTLYYSTE